MKICKKLILIASVFSFPYGAFQCVALLLYKVYKDSLSPIGRPSWMLKKAWSKCGMIIFPFLACNFRRIKHMLKGRVGDVSQTQAMHSQTMLKQDNKDLAGQAVVW